MQDRVHDRPSLVTLRDYLAAVAAAPDSVAEPGTSNELRHSSTPSLMTSKASGVPPERVIVAVKQVAGGNQTLSLHRRRGGFGEPAGRRDCEHGALVR
jgi:hypothetical protein